MLEAIDLKSLLDKIAELSIQINSIKSSLREFEKQKVQPLNERLSELEEWTRKDENRIYERIKKLEEHKNYQIDENRKISKRVDEIPNHSDALNENMEYCNNLAERINYIAKCNIILTEKIKTLTGSDNE